MNNSIFITGTDTDIGKTFVSCLLLDEFNALGLKTFAIKPIASGCERNTQGKLVNSDALNLQQHSSIHKPYSLVNPITFEPAIAPHIAAELEEKNISSQDFKQAILNSYQEEADINIIEGVGGWSVPLNKNTLIADCICDLDIPVILVVGIKLGCINHALLSYQNMLARKVRIIGWIANCLSVDTLCQEDNITTLSNWINAPLLGVIPYQCQAVGHINATYIQQALLSQAGITG